MKLVGLVLHQYITEAASTVFRVDPMAMLFEGRTGQRVFANGSNVHVSGRKMLSSASSELRPSWRAIISSVPAISLYLFMNALIASVFLFKHNGPLNPLARI
jgi:hypothetical protein